MVHALRDIGAQARLRRCALLRCTLVFAEIGGDSARMRGRISSHLTQGRSSAGESSEVARSQHSSTLHRRSNTTQPNSTQPRPALPKPERTPVLKAPPTRPYATLPSIALDPTTNPIQPSMRPRVGRVKTLDPHFHYPRLHSAQPTPTHETPNIISSPRPRPLGPRPRPTQPDPSSSRFTRGA